MERLRVWGERRPQLDVGRVRKSLRHHANDGVPPSAEGQLPADDVAVASEPPAPVGVAQDDDALTA